MAEGETDCTRWYVCDKRAGEATTHRWLIVRGAAWNNEKVTAFGSPPRSARRGPARCTRANARPPW